MNKTSPLERRLSKLVTDEVGSHSIAAVQFFPDVDYSGEELLTIHIVLKHEASDIPGDKVVAILQKARDILLESEDSRQPHLTIERRKGTASATVGK